MTFPINSMDPSPTSQNPLVTLTLLAYNQENFIREAVESVLSQTYSPLEIILSDDCSPDRTFELIEDCVKDYQGPHKIILNRNETNLGLGAHFQKVVNLSHGEWIVAAAGDDVSEAERVEELISAVQSEGGVVAAGSAYQIIDTHGDLMETPLSPPLASGAIQRRGEYDWVQGYMRNGYFGIPGLSAMWHRSLFMDFPPIGADTIAEDIVLSLRAYLTGTVIFIKEPLVRYRSHADNISGFLKGDIGLWEDKKIKFIKKVRPSLEMHLTDYNHFTQSHVDADLDPRVLNLIHYLLRRNNIRGTWWEHGFLWRLRSAMYIAKMEGVRKFRHYMLRLFPRSFYEALLKLKSSFPRLKM